MDYLWGNSIRLHDCMEHFWEREKRKPRKAEGETDRKRWCIKRSIKNAGNMQHSKEDHQEYRKVVALFFKGMKKKHQFLCFHWRDTPCEWARICVCQCSPWGTGFFWNPCITSPFTSTMLLWNFEQIPDIVSSHLCICMCVCV